MAFTVRDFEDFVRLLDKHPHWLEALRQRLLTKELLQSPKTLRGLSIRVGKIDKSLRSLAESVKTLSESVAALTEAQRRHYEEFAAHRQEFVAYRAETDRRFAELREEVAAARAEADRRFAELAEAQRRHYEEFVAYRAETDRRFAELREEVAAARAEADRRFAELAEAQRRTDEQLQELIRAQAQMQATLSRFGQVIGPAVEERMIRALREWVEGQGGVMLEPVFSIALDGIGEIDGVTRIRLRDGAEAWVLISVKTKVWPRAIRDFVDAILRNPTAVAGLRSEGIGDPVLPIVFGFTLDRHAMDAAQRARVGLLISAQGMLVPPTLWSLEKGAPIEE